MQQRRAWALPAVVAVGIAAASLAPRAFAADPHPALPQRTAAQLISAVQHSGVAAVSGSFRTVADLGLPKLPDGGGAGNQWQEVATGTALWRVWDSGPTRQRIALLGQGNEWDAVDNDGLFWTWDSSTQTATHLIVNLQGAGTGGGRGSGGVPFALPGRNNPGAATPMGLARQLLGALRPSTDVVVGQSLRVAGRPAYSLDLDPRSSGTLIGRVAIAVDATTGVPLQVQVFPRGSDSAAFAAGFTSVSFARPDPAVFRFRPPAGATVHTRHLSPNSGSNNSGSHTIGAGWTTVVENTGRPMRLSGLTFDATRAVPGGRLLTTRLFTALVGADGQTFAGAVPAGRLQQLADQPTGRPSR